MMNRSLSEGFDVATRVLNNGMPIVIALVVIALMVVSVTPASAGQPQIDSLNKTNTTAGYGNSITHNTTDTVQDSTTPTTSAVNNTTATVTNPTSVKEDSVTGTISGTTSDMTNVVYLPTESMGDSHNVTAGLSAKNIRLGTTSRSLYTATTSPPPSEASVRAKDSIVRGATTSDSEGTERRPPPDNGVTMGTGLVLACAVVRTGLVGGASFNTHVDDIHRLASTGLDRVMRSVALLRYSRWDDSDPLDHDKRERVYETIDESPGTYISAVSEAMGMPLSTVRHHIRVLEREDLIVDSEVRGRRRLYPAGTEDVELAAALTDEATAPIVDTLARQETATVGELAEEVEKDTSTVTYHLQRLEEDGIVDRERDGRAIINRLTPKIQRILAPADNEGESLKGVAVASAD